MGYRDCFHPLLPRHNLNTESAYERLWKYPRSLYRLRFHRAAVFPCVEQPPSAFKPDSQAAARLIALSRASTN